jgi:hypothetical protein
MRKRRFSGRFRVCGTLKDGEQAVKMPANAAL